MPKVCESALEKACLQTIEHFENKIITNFINEVGPEVLQFSTFFFFFFLSANKNTRDKREKRIYILQVTEAQVINPCW